MNTIIIIWILGILLFTYGFCKDKDLVRYGEAFFTLLNIIIWPISLIGAMIIKIYYKQNKSKKVE